MTDFWIGYCAGIGTLILLAIFMSRGTRGSTMLKHSHNFVMRLNNRKIKQGHDKIKKAGNTKG